MRAIEPEIKRSTILAREQYLAFQAHGGNQNELDDEERKNAEEEVGKKEGRFHPDMSRWDTNIQKCAWRQFLETCMGCSEKSSFKALQTSSPAFEYTSRPSTMRVVSLPSSFDAACLLVTWRKPLNRDLSGVLFVGGSGLVAAVLVGPAPKHVADCTIRVEKQEQQAREVKRDCMICK